MSDAAQIVTAICATITALGVPLIAYLMSRLDKKVEEVRHNTNSIKDDLVKTTDRAARAEGHAAGRKERDEEG